MKKKRHMQLRLFLFALILSVTATQAAVSQLARVTLNHRDEPLGNVLKEIEKQTNLFFFFNDNVVDTDHRISVAAHNEELGAVLDQILGGEYEWEIAGSRIAISAAAEVSQSQTPPAGRTVEGRVFGPDGNPIVGVTVVVKGTTTGTTTDQNGVFTISAAPRATLIFQFIGMKTQEVVLADQREIIVRMQETPIDVGEVVITGIYTRAKESFTGSASTYTVEELKSAGTSNLLQSLKTIDPAFAVLENNQFGSDPNHLPNLEIRGKSSMLGIRDELDADPNQPLFILDGFESTLAAINDLDINRVASITILKDAASTAIYGSKAANGVVVVETVKPEPGKLQVSYNGNVNISMPDLTSYNLMNASEKLQFDLLAGRFTGNSPVSDIALSELYNEKVKAIASGVDTYWLSEPVRVGVNQKHSLYVQGGEGNFLFGIGGAYNGNSGTMKESLREVISGNIDLVYRMSKFQFSNKFSMSRTKYTNPVVEFSSYAEAIPYYKKRGEDGKVEKWLENSDYFRVSNPLWNASLNSRDQGRDLLMSNYFVAEYFPTSEWRVRARFGITYADNDTEKFISREDTSFEDTESLEKGSFDATDQSITKYEGELSVTYAKVIGKHRINLVAGGNINSSESLTQGYGVVGFPEGDFSYPSFSNGYPENGMPVYYENINRSLDAYFNAGYSFDDRYLMDFSLRSSGSSIFGSSKKYNTTWSVGLGWNIHREKFIADNLPWVDLLKLRASIGNPGNQNFDSAQTLLTYAFQYGSLNYFGLGALLNQIGNPDLQWQTTMDRNIGIDITLLDKRLSISADYYYKVTDPLLINVGMPYSSGTTTYLTNAGEQTGQGLTVQASYYIIRDFDRRFTWMVRGNLRTQKNRIDNIGNKLSSLNSSGKGANTVRYYDGADPDDIWAVHSVGIDPSNGKELFYDKNGNYTYDFSYDDEIICGNTRPKIEGVLGTSLSYKGFSLALNFRYQMGADIFNEALYSKVENITNLNKNHDRRALYERWQNPGDMVRFKNIASSVTTPMSSRFVQRENVLTLESIYVSYDFYDGWIRKAGLSSLRVFASMRDVFHSSTIRSERGISYPFARTLEAGLSFNF